MASLSYDISLQLAYWVDCPKKKGKLILVQLKDGTPVSIHMLQPEDGPCIIMHFRKLSDRSRYFRFMSTLKQLPQPVLNQLMDVDQERQVALCLFTADVSRPRGVGIARYIRDPDNPEQAEIAIVVMDDFQNQGAGSILLERLIERARRNGIKTLTGISFPENLRLKLLIQKFKTKIRFDGQMYHFSIDLGSQQRFCKSDQPYQSVHP